MTEHKAFFVPVMMLSVAVGLVAAAILRILIFPPLCIDKCHGGARLEAAGGLCVCMESVRRYD